MSSLLRRCPYGCPPPDDFAPSRTTARLHGASFLWRACRILAPGVGDQRRARHDPHGPLALLAFRCG
jgi:hypothetical protein